MKTFLSFAALRSKEFRLSGLHLFVLAGFALAQPLYDLLGRSAEFFVAHRADPVDIFALVFVLSFGLPALLLLVESGAGLLGRMPQRILHTVWVGALVALVALPPLNRHSGLAGASVLVVAGILGVLFTASYLRFHPIRLFLTILSPTILLFPVLFLFVSPVAKLLSPAPSARASMGPFLKSKPPIVMVVFDEFSSIYLMDEKGEIDAARYPSLAALAEESYWFRNATSVSHSTLYGVPAILTGRLPVMHEKKLPTAREYPDNLFTLLAGSYQLNVVETSTALCPPQACQVEQSKTWAKRVQPIFEDVIVISLHLLLPETLRTDLPAVTDTWKGFLDHQRAPSQASWVRQAVNASHSDRARLFREFVESVPAGESPSLNFLHILLPHTPYVYLPSGKSYPPLMERGRTGEAGNEWDNDLWAVLTAQQRYLLQLQFLDRLIGELLEGLKQKGLYDRAMLIVTADHGVSFRPNDSRRLATKTNYPDIMAVPLFMKLPAQKQGHIVDANVETIDILPSVASVLGVELPWPVDGASVFAPSFAGHARKTVSQGRDANTARLEFPAEFEKKYEARDEYLRRFGTGSQPDRLYRIGPFADLVGEAVSQAGAVRPSTLQVLIDQAADLASLGSVSDYLPAFITGTLERPRETEVSSDVAVALGGRIAAVTKTFRRRDGSLGFEAMVPESVFEAGNSKEVSVYLLRRTSTGRIELTSTAPVSLERFELAWGPSGEPVLHSSTGATIPVRPAVGGGVALIGAQSSMVSFVGWAADVKNRRPAKSIVIFAGQEQVAAGRPDQYWHGLGKILGDPALDYSRFHIGVPLERLRQAEDKEVRVFAVSEEGVATQMRYKADSRAVLWQALGVGYTLQSSWRGRLSLRRSDGRTFPVQRGVARGNIDRFEAVKEQLVLAGWAADLRGQSPPPQLVLFVGDKFVYSGSVDRTRSDVAKSLGDPRFTYTGFDVAVPLSWLDCVTCDARLFVLLESGLAAELTVPRANLYSRP